MIQERPVNWLIENLKKIINEIKNIELYNAAILGKLEEVKRRWGMLSVWFIDIFIYLFIYYKVESGSK